MNRISIVLDKIAPKQNKLLVNINFEDYLSLLKTCINSSDFAFIWTVVVVHKILYNKLINDNDLIYKYGLYGLFCNVYIISISMHDDIRHYITSYSKICGISLDNLKLMQRYTFKLLEQNNLLFILYPDKIYNEYELIMKL